MSGAVRHAGRRVVQGQTDRQPDGIRIIIAAQLALVVRVSGGHLIRCPAYV